MEKSIKTRLNIVAVNVINMMLKKWLVSKLFLIKKSLIFCKVGKEYYNYR